MEGVSRVWLVEIWVREGFKIRQDPSKIQQDLSGSPELLRNPFTNLVKIHQDPSKPSRSFENPFRLTRILQDTENLLGSSGSPEILHNPSTKSLSKTVRMLQNHQDPSKIPSRSTRILPDFSLRKTRQDPSGSPELLQNPSTKPPKNLLESFKNLRDPSKIPLDSPGSFKTLKNPPGSFRIARSPSKPLYETPQKTRQDPSKNPLKIHQDPSEPPTTL